METGFAVSHLVVFVFVCISICKREDNTERIIQTSGPSNYSPYPSRSFQKPDKTSQKAAEC